MFQPTKKTTQNCFDFCICATIILDTLGMVIPSIKIYTNILVSLLLIFTDFFLCQRKNMSFFLILFGVASLLIIILSNDITNISLLVVYCVIHLGKKFANKKTIKLGLFTLVLCMLLVAIAYLFFGFNSNYDGTIWRPIENQVVLRKAFGFTHPNLFMERIFCLFAFCFLYTEKHKGFILFAALISSFFFYIFTKSRTVPSILLVLTVFFLFYLILNKKKNYKPNYQLKANSFLLLFLLFLFLSIFLSFAFAGSFLDSFLSGRLTINKNMLINGISLFGDSVASLEIFDNSYLHILICNGLIYLVFYVSVFLFEYKNMFISFYQLLILVGILLLAFMEVILLDFLFMILISLTIGKKQEYSSVIKIDKIYL